MSEPTEYLKQQIGNDEVQWYGRRNSKAAALAMLVGFPKAVLTIGVFASVFSGVILSMVTQDLVTGITYGVGLVMGGLVLLYVFGLVWELKLKTVEYAITDREVVRLNSTPFSDDYQDVRVTEISGSSANRGFIEKQLNVSTVDFEGIEDLSFDYVSDPSEIMNTVDELLSADSTEETS